MNNENQQVNAKTVSRKAEHVDLCVSNNVAFASKTNGFEQWHFSYNALPEIDFDEVSPRTHFLNHEISQPLMISCMTGGYQEATRINGELAMLCEELRIPMGVGSQRQAIQNSLYHESFAITRKNAPTIPLVSNIGAAEITSPTAVDDVWKIVDLIEANALTIHLNPLQELLQPEGTPRFRGVLVAIESICSKIDIPVIVKEVGAGISGTVAAKLLEAGVSVIDVAGAGGTSWAGVEILRSGNANDSAIFWDWGIPTAACVQEVAALKSSHSFTLVASGGIDSAITSCKALALGADISGVARPFLKLLMEEGSAALEKKIKEWELTTRKVMFLLGAQTVRELKGTNLLFHKPE